MWDEGERSALNAESSVRRPARASVQYGEYGGVAFFLRGPSLSYVNPCNSLDRGCFTSRLTALGRR